MKGETGGMSEPPTRSAVIQLGKESNMADHTEVDRVAQHYDRQVAQLHEIQKRHREEMEKRHAELRMALEAKNQELAAQNDGLVGAVGRLHARNEELAAKIDKLTNALRDSEARADRLKVDLDLVRAQADEKLTAASAEIDRLKEKQRAGARKAE